MGREANFWQPARPYFGRAGDAVAVQGLRTRPHRPATGSSWYSVVPAGVAWETFGLANGVESYVDSGSFLPIPGGPAERTTRSAPSCCPISSCYVPDEYVAAPRDWKPNTVRGEYYDLTVGEGARVWATLTALEPPSVTVKRAAIRPRLIRRAEHVPYGRRCAVTRDKTLPALDAAHIRPFSEEASHEVQTGILMRSDIHRLFD